MNTTNGSTIEQRLIEIDARAGIGAGALDVTIAGRLEPGASIVCAAHPADDFGVETAALIHEIAGHPVVCVNLRGVGRSTPAAMSPERAIAAMADDLEGVRARLGLGPWLFWGMSGGGWIGQEYAHHHPAGLAALILESACSCFRVRLADPACLLSPFHAAWRPALDERGLIAPDSHQQAGDSIRTEWTDVAGVGAVFRRQLGPALLVSPAPVEARMREVMPALWCFDARAWLGQLRTPALVLAGAADPVVPLAHAQALQEGLPGAQLAVIEGAGHVPSAQGNVEARAAIARFVRDRLG